MLDEQKPGRQKDRRLNEGDNKAGQDIGGKNTCTEADGGSADQNFHVTGTHKEQTPLI